jgi:hypothetical protein
MRYLLHQPRVSVRVAKLHKGGVTAARSSNELRVLQSKRSAAGDRRELAML